MTDPILEIILNRRRQLREAERTFEFEGETLRYRASPTPETALRLQNMRLRYNSGNGDAPSGEDMIGAADETILDCLDPESHEAWARLRSSAAAHPLSLVDVFDLADYLLARASGVPLGDSSGSSDGQPTTGRDSTDDSSSTEPDPNT